MDSGRICRADDKEATSTSSSASVLPISLEASFEGNRLSPKNMARLPQGLLHFFQAMSQSLQGFLGGLQ